MATTFGVLDGARAIRLQPALPKLSKEICQCLYDEPMSEELRLVSPYLVDLDHAPRLLEIWRAEGLGDHWGLLLRAEGTLAQVRYHLRRFTETKMPETNQPVLFRFWDPRVFRIYLPTCPPEDLARWFAGGIECFWVETEDARGLLHYTFANGSLSCQTVPLG